MIIFTYYIRCKPLAWSQEISNWPTQGGGQTVLRVTCVPKANCDLILTNGSKLREYEIPLTIVPGEFPPDEHQKAKFEKDAFGGLWFLDDQNFVHGWFYLKRDVYGAVWEQVRTGGYDDCQLELGVKPVQENVWKENPLSIVTASVTFDRKPPAQRPAIQKPKKRFFG